MNDTTKTTHYFASDGNYGNANVIGIFDTTNWTDEHWQAIDDATDGNRFRVAQNIHNLLSQDLDA